MSRGRVGTSMSVVSSVSRTKRIRHALARQELGWAKKAGPVRTSPLTPEALAKLQHRTDVRAPASPEGTRSDGTEGSVTPDVAE